MRIRKLHFTILMLSLSLLGWLFQCSTNVAGGASDTEVSATLSGTIFDAGGVVIPHARVRLRPADYRPGTLEMYPSSETVRVFDGTADSTGAFSIDKVADGEYVLEILSGDTIGAVVPVIVDSTVSVSAVLKPFGTISGNVDMYNHPGIYGKAKIEFVGTEHVGYPDTVGHFSQMVPYGEQHMRLSADTTVFNEIIVQFYVQPAQISTIGTLRMSAPGLPCYSYSCDSMVLRTLLDDAGYSDTPVEQVSSAMYGRIYKINLRGFSLPVSLAPLAQLNALGFIDLGNTGITDSCRFVMYMWGLEELLLDGNNITGLSQTFEYLAGLRTLDISNNNLSRLPAHIDALKLMKLNITGNALCDLPPSLVNWANRYSPYWLATQRCLN